MLLMLLVVRIVRKGLPIMVPIPSSACIRRWMLHSLARSVVKLGKIHIVYQFLNLVYDEELSILGLACLARTVRKKTHSLDAKQHCPSCLPDNIYWPSVPDRKKALFLGGLWCRRAKFPKPVKFVPEA